MTGRRGGAATTIAPLTIAAALIGLLYKNRARSYGRVDPELRRRGSRLRTPAVTRANLPLVRKLRKAAAQPADGTDVQERTIDGPAGPLTIYIYTRRGQAAPTERPAIPAVLYTHGGGFILGSAAGYHEAVSWYTQNLDVVAISTEYRLAPEHRYPAALDDVHCAYRWLVQHATELGIDHTRIAVAGESAGGGLTAALCQRLHDEGGQQPAFQALIYPMLDDRPALRHVPEDIAEYIWRPSSNRLGWASYLGAPVGRTTMNDSYAAAARRTNLTGLPAAWVGVGELDLFHDEDVEYARRLEADGVPCALTVVSGAYHGFDLLQPRSSASRTFRSDLPSALRAAVKPTE